MLFRQYRLLMLLLPCHAAADDVSMLRLMLPPISRYFAATPAAAARYARYMLARRR